MKNLLCTILFACAALALPAATINSTNQSGLPSNSWWAISNAHYFASSGDIIQLCEETNNVTVGFEFTKQITLAGLGIERTVFLDSIPLAQSPQYVFRFTQPANGFQRLTGCEFRLGDRTQFHSQGTVVIGGTKTDGRRVRIDHCKFDYVHAFAILSYGSMGVIDHNTFNVATGGISVYAYGDDYGDVEWASNANWGGEDFLFIERNTFYSPNPTAATDGYRGTKYVARYNVLTNLSFEVHGTESGGRYRGSRAIEVYCNTFYGAPLGNYFVNVRSGGAIIYSNTAYAAGAGLFHLTSHRNFYPFAPWGSVDGRNGWDSNYVGGAQETAQATGIGTTTVTVSGKNWTPGQWIGYTIVKTTNYTSTAGSGLRSAKVASSGWTNNQFLNHYIYTSGAYPGSIGVSTNDGVALDQFQTALDFTGGVNFSINRASEITGNTADTITFLGGGGYSGGDLTFKVGDYFQIYRVHDALDQPGRSGGARIIGDAPTVQGGGAMWQTNDPCFEWGNTVDGVNINFSPAVLTIRTNEHFINDTVKPGYVAYTFPHTLIVGASDIPSSSVATGITPGAFVANWSAAEYATNYLLDVSTSADFATFVPGFQNLSCGNVNAKVISQLGVGGTYYYRVRGSNNLGDSQSSSTVTVNLPRNYINGTNVLIRTGIF